jgi:hypothetical protein
MAFKIDKDVPLPAGRFSDNLMGIMRLLQVGDSFVVPKERINAIHPNAARMGMKFTTRRLDDGSGYRVWRIS